jgi:hypothetical protein
MMLPGSALSDKSLISKAHDAGCGEFSRLSWVCKYLI